MSSPASFDQSSTGRRTRGLHHGRQRWAAARGGEGRHLKSGGLDEMRDLIKGRKVEMNVVGVGDGEKAERW